MKEFQAAAAFPWLVYGLLFFGLGVYAFVKRTLLKYGKEVKVHVLKVVPSGNRWITYVSFDYEGKTIDKELALYRKLIEGRNYKGIYVNKGKTDNLTINAEGFSSSFAGEMILFSTGAFLIFLFFAFTYNKLMKYALIALVAMLLIWLVCIIFVVKKKK